MNQRIIYQIGNGDVAVVIPAPDCGLSINEIAAKDVPAGAAYEVVTVSDIPADRTFRNAWEKSGKTINENLAKAKAISHDKRRAARAAEFAPLDVEATIPAKAAQAEAARQVIRDKYAVMQAQIDVAASVDALRDIVSKL